MATSPWIPVDENASPWKPVEETPPAPPTGALAGAGEGLKDIGSSIAGLGHAVFHPVDTFNQMGQQQRDLSDRAAQDWKTGHKGNAVWHAIDSMLPGIGGLDASISDQYQGGDKSGALARTAVNAVPMLAAATIPKLGEMVPTRAKAGALFNDVSAAAGEQPVNLSRSLEPLERAQQLSARGHGAVSAADNLYKRINTTNPLNYAEARDWASGLSRLTAQDTMNASPSLKAQLGQVSKAFNADIGDTAASVGKGAEYEKAMKMYRQASQLNDFVRKSAPWAIGAAVGGGVAGSALKKIVP